MAALKALKDLSRSTYKAQLLSEAVSRMIKARLRKTKHALESDRNFADQAKRELLLKLINAVASRFRGSVEKWKLLEDTKQQIQANHKAFSFF